MFPNDVLLAIFLYVSMLTYKIGRGLAIASSHIYVDDGRALHCFGSFRHLNLQLFFTPRTPVRTC